MLIKNLEPNRKTGGISDWGQNGTGPTDSNMLW